MHKQICGEYLGGISAELLLQNLTNINHNCNTIDDIREFVRGFTVTAEYEFEWEGDPKTTMPTGQRFARLVVEPDE